jgi:8-oxo-dGTP pyrophosphatase MutT (NUDIX family)
MQMDLYPLEHNRGGLGCHLQSGHRNHLAARFTPRNAGRSSGRFEYGESPEETAIRETREETGLEAEIIQCLGWLFVRYFAGWPGPMIQFMYEARVIGGELRGSEEGEARIYPFEVFPGIICPERSGSWGAITAYLAGKESLT